MRARDASPCPRHTRCVLANAFRFCDSLGHHWTRQRLPLCCDQARASLSSTQDTALEHSACHRHHGQHLPRAGDSLVPAVSSAEHYYRHRDSDALAVSLGFCYDRARPTKTCRVKQPEPVLSACGLVVSTLLVPSLRVTGTTRAH